jgi:hypothetical protein
MYLIEWICWRSELEPNPESSSVVDPAGSLCVRHCTGVDPSDEFAIYRVNDRFVDLSGAWQEDRRGLVTFMFLMMMFVVNGFIFDGAVMAVRGLISGTAYSGTPLTQE